MIPPNGSYPEDQRPDMSGPMQMDMGGSLPDDLAMPSGLETWADGGGVCGAHAWSARRGVADKRFGALGGCLRCLCRRRTRH
jgi:hypothetical protein